MAKIVWKKEHVLWTTDDRIIELRELFTDEKIMMIQDIITHETAIDFRWSGEDNLTLREMEKLNRIKWTDIGAQIGRCVERGISEGFAHCDDMKRSLSDDADFSFKGLGLETKSSKKINSFTGSSHSNKTDYFILWGYDINVDVVIRPDTDIFEGLWLYVGPMNNLYWKASENTTDSFASLNIPWFEKENIQKGIIKGSLRHSRPLANRNTWLYFEREDIYKRRSILDMAS